MARVQISPILARKPGSLEALGNGRGGGEEEKARTESTENTERGEASLTTTSVALFPCKFVAPLFIEERAGGSWRAKKPRNWEEKCEVNAQRNEEKSGEKNKKGVVRREGSFYQETIEPMD